MNKKVTNDKLIRNLEEAIFAGFCALAFLIPAIFSPQISGAFSIPKLIVLLIGTAVLFGIWLVKLFFSEEIRLKIDPLQAPLGLFAILVVISFLVSIHRPTSFFGDYGRFEGLFTYVSFWVLFFISSQLNWDARKLKTFSVVLVVTAGLIAFLGLLQFLGLNVLNLTYDFNFERSSSTLGNPTVLAAYLVLIFPLSVSLLIGAGNNKSKVIFGLTGAIIMSVVITTFARGGWLALLITVILIILTRISFGLREQRIFLAGALALMVLFAFIIIATTPVRSSDTNFLERLRSAAFLREGTVGSRIEIWRGAVAVILDRPLFGGGPDTFALTFPKHQSPRLTAIHGHAGFTDNAHNYLLQLAATVGLPAAGVFFASVLIACWLGFKSVRSRSPSDKEALVLIGLIAGLAAYFIASLFEVAFLGSTFLAWVILGIIASRLSNREVLIGKLTQVKVTRRAPAAIGVALTIFSVTAVQMIALYSADLNYSKAIKYQLSGDIERSANYYREAIASNPRVNEYYQGLAWNFSSSRQDGGVSTYAEREREALQEALSNNPFMVINYTRMAEVDIFLAGQSGDEGFYGDAERRVGQALALEPNSARAYYTRGTLEYFQTKYEPAISDLERATSLDPNYAQAFYALGLAYKEINQPSKSESSLKRAASLDPLYR